MSTSSSSSTAPSKPRFWRPGTIAPGSNVEREQTTGGIASEGFILPTAPAASSVAGGIQAQRLLLPIAGHRSQILYALEKHQVLIMVGETGSGKSSQLPQYLDDAGWTRGGMMIGLTQPRRVAASTLAQRVALERGTKVGEQVGYAFRFEDCTSPETRIKYLTDGLLLREMMQDPLLRKYSVIVLDEAHERSVATDVLMALLRKVLRRRADLRLVVASATLDAERFLEYFQDVMPEGEEHEGEPSAVILTVEGRQYPVDIFYTSTPVKDYIRACVDTVLHICMTQGPGDILVFLTGREEIDRVCDVLGEEVTGAQTSNLSLRILPLYSGLSSERQTEVFAPAPHGQRKVIVSTNVAEASVTIDGVVYVVDSGFVKVRLFDPKTSRSTLAIQPISQASAKQRAGRSGRTRKGMCYRLYTEATFHSLPLKSPPELLRTDLTGTILQLKALGIDLVAKMEFMDPPSITAIGKSLTTLHSLGALDGKATLTKQGRLIAEWPLDPTLSRTLLASAGSEWMEEEEAMTTIKNANDTPMADSSSSTRKRPFQVNCSEEILSIIAMLSVEGVFLQQNQHAKHRQEQVKSFFEVHEGDHLTLLNVFNAFLVQAKKPGAAGPWCHRNLLNFKSLARAVEIRKQLKKHLIRAGIELASSEGDSIALRKAILCGFFRNLAQLHSDGTYRAIRPSGGTRRGEASLEEDQQLHIHPTSVLYSTTQSASKPQFLVYHELLQTNKNYMRDISVIEPEWLQECAPDYYELKTGYEEENRRHELIAAAAERAEAVRASGAEDTDGVVGEAGRKHRRLF